MLKALFAKQPALSHPHPEQPYIIQADISDIAFIAVHLQKNANGDLQPCAYTSKILTETERDWQCGRRKPMWFDGPY